MTMILRAKMPRAAMASAAALAITLGTGLSSCSKPAEENAAEQNAPEQEAAPAPSTEQGAAGQDATAQNAKALLKAMSDYLAAQQNVSFSYDSIFEVVSKEQQKFQIATSGTILLNRPDKIHTTRKSG